MKASFFDLAYSVWGTLFQQGTGNGAIVKF